jgi:hypothetical protein
VRMEDHRPLDLGYVVFQPLFQLHMLEIDWFIRQGWKWKLRIAGWRRCLTGWDMITHQMLDPVVPNLRC